MNEDGGDLAEFGKKRNTGYGFPPRLYEGRKQKRTQTLIDGSSFQHVKAAICT